ncbi:hypothetical protein E1293_09265 [Actinomadura darangshiensis]|uniref:Uncharacterized protein n=1 Tax=Actinomadura darangshiensis TaxID=705336 RepID=A0A4R5BNF4_9ACTN|nr:hypothetical protein [Actinomadura darangshiensis]TDD86690.1 hypothetical protein E1293_09265 [Actinomadura darangshiensis]
MMEFPPFGVLLERLLGHRQVDVDSLSQAAGVSDTELRNVVDGLRPGSELLRALAPALDLHTADLFAMAGQKVPDDLAPLDASARRYISRLVDYALCLPANQRSELRRLVRELPQERRRQPYVPRKWFDPSEVGFCALIANMLYANRNLDIGDAARALAGCSNGRMYVSASTVVMIGGGKVELTPGRLADLSTLIDVSAGDLAAIYDIPLPDGSPPDDPAAADAAALIWDVRRLSAEQLWRVCVRAEELRYALPDDAIDRKFYGSGAFRISRHPPKIPDS